MLSCIVQTNASVSSFIRKNFIALDVVLVGKTSTLVADVPTQQLVGVLAQWCGALGFWMGLSAMTVFELIQLLAAVVSQMKCAPKRLFIPTLLPKKEIKRGGNQMC